MNRFPGARAHGLVPIRGVWCLVLAACNTTVPPETIRRFEDCRQPAGRESFERARQKLSAGHDAEAVPDLEDGLRVCPENVVFHQTYQDVMTRLDREADMRRFYAGLAIPDRSPVRLLVASRLESDDDKRVGLLRRSLQDDPGFYPAQLAIGRIRRRQGQYEEAVQALDAALTMNPALADADLELAELKAENGAAIESATHYRRYLAVHPQDRRARLGFVRLLIESGRDLDEATTSLDRLLREEPEGPDLLTMQAALLWKRGELAAAAGVYRRLLRLDNNDARSVLNLGNLCFAELNDLRRARWCYLHYLQMTRTENAADVMDRLFTVPLRLAEIDKKVPRGPDDRLPPVTEL